MPKLHPRRPQQFFHIHGVILAPDVGNFESISIGNSMNYKQHVFMHYILLSGGIYAGVTPERRRRHEGRKNRDRGLITNENVLKQEQDTATRGTYEWEDP